MTAPGWPAVLGDGDIGLRPLRLRDAAVWSQIRTRNEAWLRPWEVASPGSARLPWADRHTQGAYIAMLRNLRRGARVGVTLPFAVTRGGGLAGAVTVSAVSRGGAESGQVGYWVDERLAGRGIMPTALALLADHCFGPARLHRLEAHVRPDNTASRRVLDKLGFREEGLLRRYLPIDGIWWDHVLYALTADDAPQGVLRRWHARRDTPSA